MTVAVTKLTQIYPRLVQHMGAEDREYIAGALQLKRLAAGVTILRYGEDSNALFLIAEGDLRVYLPTGKGDVELGTRGAGRWVGELGVIEPGPASATVETASDVTLWVLTHDAFERMRKDRPCAAARLMEEVSRDVAERLRTCNTVTFRRDEAGHLELVPTRRAGGGAFARLLHELRDLFHGGEAHVALGNPEAAATLREPLDLEGFVASHPAFGRLGPDDRKSLVLACEVKSFPDGHAFIREGESRDALYFVLEGQAEIAVRRPKQATFAVDRLVGPGEILGLIAIVDRGPRSASCVARGGLQVAALPVEAASLLMNTRAPISCAFQYALASQLAHDARCLNESLLSAAARTA